MTTAIATSDAEGKPPEPPKAPEQPGGVVLHALTAVAAGVGVLGFVTFFGGAILWVRAREAGLPANDAIAVIPKPVLVTTGASFLVPAALLAVGTVGAVYAIHLLFHLPRQIKTARQAAEASRFRREADEAKLRAKQRDSYATEARSVANTTTKDYQVATAAIASLEPAEGSTADSATELIARISEQAAAHEEAAQEAEHDAREADLAAAKLEARADLAEATLRLARKNGPILHRVQRVVEYGAALCLLSILPVIVNWGAVFHTSPTATAILLLLAAATFALSIATYLATDKFLWFGLVAFIGVGVFIGAATYFRTKGELKVEAAAVLRDGHPPAFGWFVAETADNLYLGTFAEGSGKKRLLVIPQSQVKDLAVGPLLSPTAARARAIALALDLCAQDTTVAPAATTGGTPQAGKKTGQPSRATQACSKRQVAALNGASGRDVGGTYP